MNESRKVTVTVELAPLDVLLLDATATHLGKSRAEVVADALRLLFVAIPRPDDAAPLERSPGLDGASALERSSEIEASKPGATSP